MAWSNTFATESIARCSLPMQVQDNIAVDFGLRGAHVNDHTVGEIRAGVTFAFGVTKGPDILSRLIATTLHGVH